MSQNCEMQVACGMESNGLDHNKGNCGKRCWAPYYYLKYSFHFFNKTDFEQNFCKVYIKILLRQ